MKQIASNERALPLYQAGLAAGTDIGLRVARPVSSSPTRPG
jgi:hypothetical protein